MSRPALRIIRHDDANGAPRFVFEVWDPWSAQYRAEPDLDSAVRAVDHLLERVRQSWVSHDTALTALTDPPEPDLPESLEWAEFRASAQANRVHETRNFDTRHWRKAMGGRAGALETTCNEVGYPRGV